MAETRDAKRIKREADLADENERLKSAVDGIAEEFVCPITQELPVDPVLAEDGKVYERSAIAEWLSKKHTSPSNGADMGTKLLPAPQVKNTIEALVKSGAISGDRAEAWRKKLEDETKVKEMRAKAEKGDDGEAMYQLGEAYCTSKHGLNLDFAQARTWYEKAAALRHVKASGSAERGSDHAAWMLGRMFSQGKHGMPVDKAQARYWFQKVVDGKCEHKHLTANGCAWAKSAVSGFTGDG